MNNRLRLYALSLVLAVSLSARERVAGWCENGNQAVVIPGASNSTTKVQRSYPSCTVTVYDAGGMVLSTIYSDNAGTLKANPFTAATSGQWFFYANNGRYDVNFSGAGIAAPFTLGDKLLFDYATGIGIVSLNGLSGAAQTFTNDTNVTITSAALAHVLDWAGSLSVPRGGTGAATFTANGVMLGNAAAALAVTAAGAAYQPLRIPALGGAPAFGAIDVSQAAAVTGALGIANGGTGQVTANPAFNALAPTTTKGDLIVRNATVNARLGVGTDGYCLQADSTTATGVKWGTCIAGTLGVASGGTGATTLTGALVGAGTAAITGVAAASQLQYFRRKPNVTATTYEFGSPWWLNSADFNFPAQTPGGALTNGIVNTVTLTPCPLGTNGVDTAHYLYITGGVGAAEAVLISGGTCTSGLATGTVTFTPANDHSGAWTIVSATQGAQEAVCYLPFGDNTVRIPQGTVTLNANLGYCAKTSAVIFVSNGVTLAGAGSLPTPNNTTQFLVDLRANYKITGNVEIVKYIVQGVGAVLASAATITPTHSIHHVSGVAAIATITVPSGFSGGCIHLIPDGVFTTVNTDNISVASTAVVNTVLTMCWDGAKWNPSY